MIIAQQQFKYHMKAGKSKELDYLLINLNESSASPIYSTALAYRQKHSLREQPMTFFGTLQYSKFGPGVKLYFTLLKYMISLFLLLSVASIPSLLVNYRGNGLTLYGNSWSQTFMRFSLANQPSLILAISDLSMQQHLQMVKNVKINQIIIITNDLICSLIIICFLIFWQLKTEDLVGELLQKETLPSYHTLLVDLPPDNDIEKDAIITHFSKFGIVKQVEFVRNYGDFLLELKDFLKIVQQYSQQLDPAKRYQLYDRIGQNYLRIKHCYDIASKSGSQQPFVKVKAFVYLQDYELAKRVHGLYKYKVQNMGLDLNGHPLRVRKCLVEPLSIIWQNFHLKDNSQYLRSAIFGLAVALILLLTLFGIFILSLHANGLTQEDPLLPNSSESHSNVTFSQASQSNNSSIINEFCSGLTYKNFQWKYYELCGNYFQHFESHYAFVGTLSLVIMMITIVLIKIVFMLAELRRFRTIPEKKRFMIISIFLTYLISSSLLTILIRAQFKWGDSSFSLVEWAQSLFPGLSVRADINVYSEMNRKWYMEIGKLLIANYLLTLNICPWLYVIEEWTLQKCRQLWAKRALTQKYMNQRMLDKQFYWQFYYGVQLNSIYFCLIFSVAMPLLYVLALFSIASLFITSKIIFHFFTRKPQIYDHKQNSSICRAVGIGVVLHQITTLYTLNVEQIFAIKETQILSKQGLHIFYISLAFLLALTVINFKKIAALIRKRKLKSNEELIITQQINSTFGAKKQDKQQHPIRSPEFKVKQGVSYLNSYKMQDNPYYNTISYTLLIIQQAIFEHKNKSERSSLQYPQLNEKLSKPMSISMCGPNKRQEQLHESERNLSF